MLSMYTSALLFIPSSFYLPWYTVCINGRAGALCTEKKPVTLGVVILFGVGSVFWIMRFVGMLIKYFRQKKDG